MEKNERMVIISCIDGGGRLWVEDVGLEEGDKGWVSEGGKGMEKSRRLGNECRGFWGKLKNENG